MFGSLLDAEGWWGGLTAMPATSGLWGKRVTLTISSPSATHHRCSSLPTATILSPTRVHQCSSSPLTTWMLCVVYFNDTYACVDFCHANPNNVSVMISWVIEVNWGSCTSKEA